VMVVHCVICVREFAACSSSLFAMVGRMDERPLVKNGDANINKTEQNSSGVWPRGSRR